MTGARYEIQTLKKGRYYTYLQLWQRASAIPALTEDEYNSLSDSAMQNLIIQMVQIALTSSSTTMSRVQVAL